MVIKMAGTMTHAIFADDLGKKINFNKEYMNNLKTFSQGHDIFFFLFKFNKKEKKIGNYFHTHDTRDFFINMITYIKNNNLDNNDEILSFLYGYINHYVLDKTIHPYVKYKTGNFKKKDKSTYKYNSKHAVMEAYLDAYLIKERFNINPGKFKSNKYALKPHKFSKELKNVIDYTFNETYNYKNAGKKYELAIHNMSFLYWLLRKDSIGFKKFAYSTVDKITLKKAYKFTPISYHINIEKNEYYLNEKHSKWNHPKDINEVYTESVFDLYNNALKEAEKIIIEVDKYFKGKKIDLRKIFDNSSFSSGKDCLDKRKEQYFAY